jgi:riboflavin-specific deaminase-like protein
VNRDEAWALVRELAARASAGAPAPDRDAALAGRTPADPRAAAMLELYLPLCVGPAAPALIVAHLAQSLDGRIATTSGASRFISGEEDVDHAHRLRALVDAILVGAGTVERDDPRLTTRRVPGDDPVRVVLDPARRLAADHAVFRDGAAPTLLVCRADAGGPPRHGRAEVVPIAASGPELPLAAVRAALAARGLRRLFVEGGGIAVSRFLAAGLLDRLHVAVAPCILGSGRPAFALPPIDGLDAALRLDVRHVALGPDVLFDCVVRR